MLIDGNLLAPVLGEALRAANIHETTAAMRSEGETRRLLSEESPPHGFDLKLHIRKVRAELEARGVWIDDDLDEILLAMMRCGREAIEAGRPPLRDDAYRHAAAKLHRLVRERENGAHTPQIANYRFPGLLRQIDELNRAIRKRTRFPPGLYKLIDLANRKAQTESELATFLREIEWHLRMT